MKINMPNSPSSISWTKEKMAALLEKQGARLRAYKAALAEHRFVMVVLLAIILFMSALFAMLFFVNLRLARDHNLLLAYSPQRIHLVFDESQNSLAVEWYTRNRTDHSIVWYGPKAFSSSAFGSQKAMEEPVGGSGLFKHKVFLGNLVPGINYQYKVGSEEVISEVRYFKIPDHRISPAGRHLPPLFGLSSSSDVLDPALKDAELEKMLVESAKALDGLLQNVIQDIDSLFKEEKEDDEKLMKDLKVFPF